jgi:phage antirepressor YoqD-like protein
MEAAQATTGETKMAPKAAKFDRITEADGYKLVPSNAAARKFCEEYGTDKLRISEAIALKIRNINWGK